MGKIFVCDTSLSEKFSWMEANHENNEIKSTTKIFTYTVVVPELEITVSHQPFSNHFPTILGNWSSKFHFARTNLLHIFGGEANDSL